MKIEDALTGVQCLHIETAPLIYFVEQNPSYVDRMRFIFQLLQAGNFHAVSSVITLAEVLAHPLCLNRHDLEKVYLTLLTRSKYFKLIPVSQTIAREAANLRALDNLKTPDALQPATALESQCDTFLTNDKGLMRVTSLKIILIDDLDNP